MEKLPASPEAIVVEFLTTSEGPKRRPRSVGASEFDGTLFQLLRLPESNRLLVGIGLRSELKPEVLRHAASTALSKIRSWQVTQVTLDLRPHLPFAAAAVEGSLLGHYRFENFRQKKGAPVARLTLVCGPKKVTPALRQSVQAAATVTEAVNYARQINNLPGNVLYPETLAQEARKMAKSRKLRVTVLGARELKERGFGGMLAVGGGSARPPRLIVIEHAGHGPKRDPIALVGKAITFDTGGISIKPASGMEEMVFDKSGGTTVLGTMAALADLDFPNPVVGIIAAAENMPGSNAYRPGDIVTMYDGTTVEIINTDAEGRMVLGDAIAYARKDKRACIVIDLATLTGACGVALGAHVAGVWSTEEKLERDVLEAARAAGEPMWPMPMRDEYKQDIASTVATIKNSGGRLAGACTAAAFLRSFAGETPWLHLDIAFPSALTAPRHGLPKGATGFGVRTLIAFLKKAAG